LTKIIDDKTLAGDVRAGVSFDRDNGVPVDSDISFVLAIADLLEIPDDMPLMPAVSAAMSTPTRLDDPDSVAYTRNVAIAAGSGKLSAIGKQQN
jgi:hypothetical protein